ncbi:MAG: YHS domain-containing protein [Pseudohongiellaceae bacterium]|jgi:YHS domain-containing protein
MSIRSRLVVFVATVLFSTSGSVFAGADTETDNNDVILAGHDVVAYFTQGKPVLGDEKYTDAYNGAIYRFSSAKSRDLFRVNPAQYAPVYGGVCAYGMTFGKKFEIDGKAFEIVDGRLYVNKNIDVYEAWKKDVPTHIEEANKKWSTVENIPGSKL